MKKLTSYLLIGVMLGVGITVGATAGATGVTLVQSIFGQISTAVRGNTDAKLANLNQEIQTQLSSTFDIVNTQQTDRATKEIDAYYAQKIAALSSDPAVNDAAFEVIGMTTLLITEEKTRIDTAVNTALGK